MKQEKMGVKGGEKQDDGIGHIVDSSIRRGRMNERP
jgi:hypothetical protein